jgi:hypothetical protein
VEFAAFDRTCYEFNIGKKGGSFEEARSQCKKRGGDLAHGLRGVHNTFLLAELERRKPRFKTQLVWIGAHKEPGFTSRTWKWVNGKTSFSFFNNKLGIVFIRSVLNNEQLRGKEVVSIFCANDLCSKTILQAKST